MEYIYEGVLMTSLMAFARRRFVKFSDYTDTVTPCFMMLSLAEKNFGYEGKMFISLLGYCFNSSQLKWPEDAAFMRLIQAVLHV